MIGLNKTDSLEWEDPTLEVTKHIPNQHVDEGTWSHAGDDLDLNETDEIDSLVDQVFHPKFR